MASGLPSFRTHGGPLRVKGRLDELGTVTVNGSNAPLDSRYTNFVGYASVTNGTNVVSVTATDYSGNARTNNYLVNVTNLAGSLALQYDLNGNMTNDGGGLTYEYDAANRTVAINRGTTNRTEFAYDGLGRRVQIIEKVNGTAISTNRYVWVGQGLAEERDSTGATVTKRFFGQGEQIGGTNYYFTTDHLGSVREMTDAAGTVQARYDYDPYGRRTKVSGSMDADFGFTGHFLLASQPETTLTLYRLYRADLGRWLSKDPLAEAAGLNLYDYVGNNPINAIDPDGRIVIVVVALAATFLAIAAIGQRYSAQLEYGKTVSSAANNNTQTSGTMGTGWTAGMTPAITDIAHDLAGSGGTPEGGTVVPGPIQNGKDTAVAVIIQAIDTLRDTHFPQPNNGRWITKTIWTWRQCKGSGEIVTSSAGSPGAGWYLESAKQVTTYSTQ